MRSISIHDLIYSFTEIYDNLNNILKIIEQYNSIESTYKEIKKYKYMGNFMAYQIAMDLTYTSLLNKAKDIKTFTVLGPGAITGISYFNYLGISPNLQGAQKLLKIVKNKLKNYPPKFDISDLEHSLCELGKYQDILSKDKIVGRRLYKGSQHI